MAALVTREQANPSCARLGELWGWVSMAGKRQEKGTVSSFQEECGYNSSVALISCVFH